MISLQLIIITYKRKTLYSLKEFQSCNCKVSEWKLADKEGHLVMEVIEELAVPRRSFAS